MDFLRLPSTLVAKILSYTNDITVYNMCITCKGLNNTLNNIKQDIIWKRYDKDVEYGLYDVYDNSRLSSKNETDESTEVDNPLNHILENTEAEDVYEFTSKKCLRSVIMITRLSLQNETVCDLLTSIKVKGVIETFSLDFSIHTVVQEIGPLLRLGILKKDADGFYEVLTPFIKCLPLFCMNFFEPYMNITSKGDVIIKTTKCCVEPDYLQSNSWNSILMLSQIGQPCKISKMLSDICHSNIHCTDQAFIKIPIVCKKMVKGLCIIMRKRDNMSYVPQQQIKTFEVTFKEASKSIIIAARRSHTEYIKNYSKLYNLKFFGENFYYIPLQFHSIEEGTRGVICINMVENLLPKEQNLCIDVVQWSEEIHSFYTGWNAEQDEDEDEEA
jgi:hypothetical protein